MPDYPYLDLGEKDVSHLDPSLLKYALMPGVDFHLDRDNALTVKQSPLKEKAEGVSKETPAASTPLSDPHLPFSAYASLMAPSVGPTAAELKGLTPEQVTAVMSATGAAGEMGRRTMADIEGWGMREVQRRLLEARVREAMAPEIPTALEEARTKKLLAGPSDLEIARTKKLLKGPSDLEKAQTEWKKAQTEALKLGKPSPKIPELEKKIQLAGVDQMRKSTHDKDGNILDPENVDIERLTALDERLRKSDKKVIELEMPKLVKDWAFDISGRPIHMVVDVGVTLDTLSDQDIANTLISQYGYSAEDAKAIIKIWREGS